MADISNLREILLREAFHLLNMYLPAVNALKVYPKLISRKGDVVMVTIEIPFETDELAEQCQWAMDELMDDKLLLVF